MIFHIIFLLIYVVVHNICISFHVKLIDFHIFIQILIRDRVQDRIQKLMGITKHHDGHLDLMSNINHCNMKTVNCHVRPVWITTTKNYEKLPDVGI